MCITVSNKINSPQYIALWIDFLDLSLSQAPIKQIFILLAQSLNQAYILILKRHTVNIIVTITLWQLKYLDDLTLSALFQHQNKLTMTGKTCTWRYLSFIHVYSNMKCKHLVPALFFFHSFSKYLFILITRHHRDGSHFSRPHFH